MEIVLADSHWGWIVKFLQSVGFSVGPKDLGESQDIQVKLVV